MLVTSVSRARRLRDFRRDRGDLGDAGDHSGGSRGNGFVLYAAFRRPVGKYVLQVCRGLACAIDGAERHHGVLSRETRNRPSRTTDDGLFSYEEVECLAACDRATCMQVNLEFVYDLTPQSRRTARGNTRRNVRRQTPGADRRAARTWEMRQDEQIGTGHKSPGAIGVASPNNAGGVGDESGAIMLDNIINRRRRVLPRYARARRHRLAGDRRESRRSEAQCRSLKF